MLKHMIMCSEAEKGEEMRSRDALAHLKPPELKQANKISRQLFKNQSFKPQDCKETSNFVGL